MHFRHTTSNLARAMKLQRRGLSGVWLPQVAMHLQLPRFLVRYPDSVGTALSFTAKLFLSIHFSQTSRRGHPSNLYARFGPR